MILMCSSNDCGMPGGTAKFSGAAVVALAAICIRRSISRTLSVKASRRARSGTLISVRMPLILSLTESRMLWSRSRRCCALLGGAAAAEHALEYDLRIQFHRQRRGRRCPRDRVGVDAAVAFAAVARTRTRVFHRNFHRRQQRFLPVPGGDDLVDGLAGVNVGAGGLAAACAHTGTRRRPSGRRRFHPAAARRSANAGRSEYSGVCGTAPSASR